MTGAQLNTNERSDNNLGAAMFTLGPLAAAAAAARSVSAGTSWCWR